MLDVLDPFLAPCVIHSEERWTNVSSPQTETKPGEALSLVGVIYRHMCEGSLIEAGTAQRLSIAKSPPHFMTVGPWSSLHKLQVPGWLESVSSRKLSHWFLPLVGRLSCLSFSGNSALSPQQPYWFYNLKEGGTFCIWSVSGTSWVYLICLFVLLSLGRPRTHYVNQSGLELGTHRDLPL